jgi:hypothetical protein
MKKVFLAVLLIMLISINLPAVKSQINEESVKEGVESLEEAKKNVEKNITNINETTNYITKSWIDYLEKRKIGKVLIEIGKVLSALSPIFILFIGIEYSLSWLFFLSLIITIIITIFIYRPIKDFFDINPIFALIISLTIVGLIARAKAIPKALESMSFLIPNKWALITSIIVTAGVVYVYWILVKKFGKKFRESRKKEKDEERELKDEALDKIKDIKLKKGL